MNSIVELNGVINSGKAKKNHYGELDNFCEPFVSLFFVFPNHFLFYFYDLGIPEFIYAR
jgi:hypothetical protein